MKSTNPIVMILGGAVLFLLGAALGGMYVKIQYLEGKGGSALGANTPQTQAAAPTAPNQPPTPTTVNVTVGADDPVKGSPNAKVAVVEFSDFQCPFCERFFTDVEPQIIKEYVDTGKVKFVYKSLAFLGKESSDAANAAMCAKEQNKFWEYHDILFKNQSGENQGAFAVDKLKGFAANVGLNTSQFNQCLDAQKYNAQVQADADEASKVGFNSTPSIAVGTQAIIGSQPYAQFKAAIDAELAKAK